MSTPAKKAASFPLGTRKRGRDNRIYAVTADKNGHHRWKYSPPTKTFQQGDITEHEPAMRQILSHLSLKDTKSLASVNRKSRSAVAKHLREDPPQITVQSKDNNGVFDVSFAYKGNEVEKIRIMLNWEGNDVVNISTPEFEITKRNAKLILMFAPFEKQMVYDMTDGTGEIVDLPRVSFRDGDPFSTYNHVTASASGTRQRGKKLSLSTLNRVSGILINLASLFLKRSGGRFVLKQQSSFPTLQKYRNAQKQEHQMLLGIFGEYRTAPKRGKRK